MGSSGHRANILNSDLTEIGIGYEYLANDTGSVNYNHYWTTTFAGSILICLCLRGYAIRSSFHSDKL